jgi:GNAT superfamily N-acetyltransferase
MSRRLVNLTLDTLADLPQPCRECVFWELDPRVAEVSGPASGGGLEKEAWISQTLLEWGSCGKLVYVEDTPAGYVIYAPPGYLPRAAAFPTAPVSPDAALLTTVHVVPGYAGRGLGRALVQAAARDLVRRGRSAVEAFGAGRGTPAGCVAPADFFVAVGFKTIRPHRRYPRLRLELRTGSSWQEIGYALEELLDPVSPAGSVEGAARRALTSIEPVGTSDSTG